MINDAEKIKTANNKKVSGRILPAGTPCTDHARAARRRHGMENIFARLPDDLARSLRGLPERIMDDLEEIRFRVNRPVIVYSGGREYEIAGRGSYAMSRDGIGMIFSLLMEHSDYAYQDQIRSGYITLDGGHRVGICGRVITDNGHLFHKYPPRLRVSGDIRQDDPVYHRFKRHDKEYTHSIAAPVRQNDRAPRYHKEHKLYGKESRRVR